MTADQMRKQLVGVRLLALEMNDVIAEIRHQAAARGVITYEEFSSKLLKLNKLIEPLFRAGKEE